MRHKLIAAFFFFMIFLITNSPQVEARVLPQAKGAVAPAAKKTAYSGIIVSPRLRADRNALEVSFSNLQNATSITYNLYYQTNGKEEGAGGTIAIAGASSLSRELLFGTCSGVVCRYHTNITDMKFEITSELTNGKKILKRYRIKV